LISRSSLYVDSSVYDWKESWKWVNFGPVKGCPEDIGIARIFPGEVHFFPRKSWQPFFSRVTYQK